MEAAAAAAADIENLSTVKVNKEQDGQRVLSVGEQDPLAIVKAQLTQQDAKLEQMSSQLVDLARHDNKIEQMGAQLKVLAETQVELLKLLKER